jgi:hypothetical protein
MKKLEDTIRELQAKYKNKPSPLSENYRKFAPQMVPQQNQKPADARSFLLGDFKPTSKSW